MLLRLRNRETLNSLDLELSLAALNFSNPLIYIVLMEQIHMTRTGTGTKSIKHTMFIWGTLVLNSFYIDGVLAQSMSQMYADEELVEYGFTSVDSSPRLNYQRFPVSLEIDLRSPDSSSPEFDHPETELREPVPIGVPRAIPEPFQGDLLRNATWTNLSDGSQITSITVRSEDASRLRVALRAELPEGSKVRFFSLIEENQSSYPVYSISDFERRRAHQLESNLIAGMIWSPIVDGDTLGIEIELPSATMSFEAKMQIVRASHLFSDSASLYDVTTHIYANQTDETCSYVNTACREIPQDLNNSVVRILATNRAGTTAQCSGTLVNTARSTLDNRVNPYILTAQHCIATQDMADTAEFDFFYYNTGCEDSQLSNRHTTLRSGARIMVEDPVSDLILLELRSPSPGGSLFAGWSFNFAGNQSPDSSVISIGHPNGEPQKYAAGNPERYSVVKISGKDRQVLEVDWSDGVTSPGSSGGGLWGIDEANEQWRLLGALSGAPGATMCNANNISFGRFDVFYVNEAHNYLNPNSQQTDDYGGSFTTATGILSSSTVSGEISHGADADMFKIVLSEAGTLKLTTTGEVDTHGHLMLEDGTILTSDGSGGYAQNFRISIHVSAGTYFVRVSGYDTRSVGDYRLHASFRADSDTPTAEIPLFWAASHTDRKGLISLTNLSSEAGIVDITAIDDAGTNYGPVTLSISALQTHRINSIDLENGNQTIGLRGQTGPGFGEWRLRIDTSLRIQVTAYSEDSDGFLTSLNETVYFDESLGAYVVPIFMSAGDDGLESKLRIINSDMNRSVKIGIAGFDEAGNSSADRVEMTLAAGSSHVVDATQLENGFANAAGNLGDGQGNWYLVMDSEGDIVVLNLLESDSGLLSNLSAPGHISY